MTPPRSRRFIFKQSEIINPMIDYSNLVFRVAPMRVQDVDAVMQIELAAFSAPWSARAYQYELHHNASAHYFVAFAQNDDAPMTRLAFWQRWIKMMRGQTEANGAEPIIGYAGFWMMTDEAHISTIASHPDWRRRGVGELLMLAMIEAAAEHNARVLTLEVRVSNQDAQALYRKHGFNVVGERKRYYSDNQEDALIMTTPPITMAEYQRDLQNLKSALLARLSR
jgi:ribosomal-protein-alanine N-acetyltransferase